MTMRPLFAAAFLVSLASSSDAQVSIGFVSRTGDAFAGNDEDAFAVDGFGDTQANAEFVVGLGEGYYASASGSAFFDGVNQLSLQANAFASAVGSGLSGLSASADSTTSVTFTIDTPHTAAVELQELRLGPNASAGVSLEDVSNDGALINIDFPNRPTLEAGEYVIRVEAAAFPVTNGPEATAEMFATLTLIPVPEPTNLALIGAAIGCLFMR